MNMPKNYLRAHAALAAQRPAPKRISLSNEGDSVRLNIFDEIGPWGVTASDFLADFQAFDIGGRPVHVHINSPGGDVYDGLAIYNTLKNSGSEIVVHIDGLAASAASFIAMAGTQILMSRNAEMMVHDASSMIYGNAQDMRETADWLDGRSDNIADIYAQRAGGKAETWRETMRAETWYSAEQAVKAGLADTIEGSAVEDKIPSLAASMFKTPDGQAQPVNQEPDDLPDFDSIAQALKGAFS